MAKYMEETDDELLESLHSILGFSEVSSGFLDQFYNSLTQPNTQSTATLYLNQVFNGYV